jgi:ATP-dependent protease Clp ATPase subunit
VSAQDLLCAFCGSDRSIVAELILGPNVTICNVCVNAATQLANERGGDAQQSFPEPCSFCRQHRSHLQFARERVRICDLCIEMCVDIIEEERARTKLPAARAIKH